MLVCIRERAGEVVIPSGNTDLKAGDKISVVIPMAEIGAVLQRLRLRKRAIHSVLIAGGGNTAVYLTLMLQRAGLQVKIIENSLVRCEELAERVPKVTSSMATPRISSCFRRRGCGTPRPSSA